MSGYEVDRRRSGDSMLADVMPEQASTAFRFDRLFMTLASSLSLLLVMVALAAIPSSSVALVVVRSATLWGRFQFLGVLSSDLNDRYGARSGR
ncbi:hypothetical protein [Oceanibaculum nanhaiense]|uniref:hypothetical protein n=1 Tax=Oceanibaculum nanhaiense TaxID=1909734 RepID=UPI00396EC49F